MYQKVKRMSAKEAHRYRANGTDSGNANEYLGSGGRDMSARTKTCGALGCTDPADAVIDHSKHGALVVCELHVSGHDIVKVVRDE